MPEPVTLAELKAFARVDHDDDDALITSLGTAATAYVTQATGRAFADMDERAALAVKALCATWYEQREALALGQVSEVPMHVKRLVHQLTDWSKLKSTEEVTA